MELPLNIVMHGRGTAVQSMLDILGIEETEKRVIVSVCRNDKTAEFIREQIFKLYQKEVPYSTFVEVEKFTEDLGPKNYIRANIHVERESQKPILIGKGGSAIAELRKRAQKRIEEFLGRKYRLELNVVVSPNWRNDTKSLEEFGYIVRDEK